MAKWVDFKTIKEKVSIEAVLNHYGLLDKMKRKDSANALVGPCPIHKGTNPNQFHVSLTKNNFNCFGDCHGGGNVLDLVAKLEKTDIRNAALKIQAWFNLEAASIYSVSSIKKTTNNKLIDASPSLLAYVTRLPEYSCKSVSSELLKSPQEDTGKDTKQEKLVKEKKEKASPEPQKNQPLQFALNNLDCQHPYLKERGLSPETIEAFKLGYCAKGLMKDRIAIPVHNENGALVAYIGRWTNGELPAGEGKYKIPPNFHKSLVVFNLHRAKNLAQEKGLILVEGFFGCMQVWQAGFKNAVALMGSSLSEEQEKLIVEAVGSQGKIVLMFDGDKAGQECKDSVLVRLVTQVYVKVVNLPEGKQPDNLSNEEIKELLS